MEKVFDFGKSSFMKLTVNENGVNVNFQAKHLEDDFKITSINVTLTKEEIIELQEWLLKAQEEVK